MRPAKGAQLKDSKTRIGNQYYKVMTCETIGKTKQKNCKLKQCQIMSQSAICSCLFTSTLNVDIIAKGKKCKIKQKINFPIP